MFRKRFRPESKISSTIMTQTTLLLNDVQEMSCDFKKAFSAVTNKYKKGIRHM